MSVRAGMQHCCGQTRGCKLGDNLSLARGTRIYGLDRVRPVASSRTNAWASVAGSFPSACACPMRRTMADPMMAASAPPAPTTAATCSGRDMPKPHAIGRSVARRSGGGHKQTDGQVACPPRSDDLARLFEGHIRDDQSVKPGCLGVAGESVGTAHPLYDRHTAHRDQANSDPISDRSNLIENLKRCGAHPQGFVHCRGDDRAIGDRVRKRDPHLHDRSPGSLQRREGSRCGFARRVAATDEGHQPGAA